MQAINYLNVLPQEWVVWGQGALADVAANLGERGLRRPIIFTTRSLEATNRKLVQPYLKGSVGVYSCLLAHAPDTTIEAAFESCMRLGAESLVAHGGGSVLDSAKAVSYLHYGRTGRYIPIVALPTTLSGSEFSHYFGVTETTGPKPFKRSYAIRETVPKIVVLDPILLVDTPRALLLSSAIKSIDHAVEGMRNVSTSHPHAVMAAKGLQQFVDILQRWPEHMETPEAFRSGAISADDLQQLQLAAWNCYFCPASVIYGLSHRIGHILGGSFGLPHSVTSCITLAPVIRACAKAYGDKLKVFFDRRSEHDYSEILSTQIAGLVKMLGLPNRIGAFGLDKRDRSAVVVFLKRNYPNEIRDLGDDAERKLERLMDHLW